MSSSIKRKIALFLAKRRFFNKKLGAVSFNKFITNSEKFLLILPTSGADLLESVDVCKYLLTHQKDVTLFGKREGEKYELDEGLGSIVYTDEEISKLNLPRKELLEKLRSKKYDVVIDLNRHENFFLSVIANTVETKFRIGFKKGDSDKFYKFQVANNKNNSEISYRNLLNSLLMF